VAAVFASNMSRGVHTLTRLTELAAQALPDHESAIVEIHHKKKVDAPSGTALQLAATVESAGGHQVEVSSVRGGDVVGEHQVMFLGPGEQIILTHRATTREHFCRGAIAAVRFVAGRAPGLYSMADVFGDE
jgi:4-hydroxy-tetrahydrodipicolinate reductase